MDKNIICKELESLGFYFGEKLHKAYYFERDIENEITTIEIDLFTKAVLFYSGVEDVNEIPFDIMQATNIQLTKLLNE